VSEESAFEEEEQVI